MTESSGFEEYSHFFEVRLDLFDGPIDLLLHLVKKNELPIEKLSLACVASQYLECIEGIRSLDLEVAGEYLVIAATLVSIKSSILLNEPVELEVDQDGNLFDPHQELLERLRRAEIYKDTAHELGQRSLLDIDVFSSDPPDIHEIRGEVKFKQHAPILLGIAFRKLLDRLPENEGMKISIEPISIVERMMGVLKDLESRGGTLEFTKLIPDLSSRSSIVASFVAILELCKRNVITLKQEETFGEIFVSLATDKIESESITSEFDDEPVKAHG